MQVLGLSDRTVSQMAQVFMSQDSDIRTVPFNSTVRLFLDGTARAA
jgi:hypothetical protein